MGMSLMVHFQFKVVATLVKCLTEIMSDLKSLHCTRALCSSLQHVKLEYVRAGGLVSKTRVQMTALFISASFGRRKIPRLSIAYDNRIRLSQSRKDRRPVKEGGTSTTDSFRFGGTG